MSDHLQPIGAQNQPPGQSGSRASVLLVVLVIVVIALFVGAQLHNAQSPTAGRLDSKSATSVGLGPTFQSNRESRKQAILESLNRTIPFHYENQQLEDVIRDIAQRVGQKIVIDRATIVEEGVALDQPITIHTDDISARSALDLLFRGPQLSWVIVDEVLLVTSSIRASEMLTTVVYDVRDLVETTTPEGNIACDFASLIDTITTVVQPDSWDEVGGPGSIREFQADGIAALAARQSRTGHEDITALLADLRRNRRAGADSSTRRAPREVSDRQPRVKATRFPPASPLPPDPGRDAVVLGNNQFAFELFAQLARENSGNLLFSPYSISSAVAMTYAGARGDTALEIASTMHFGLRQDDVATAQNALFSALVLNSIGFFPPPFHVANRLWGRNGLEFQQQFLETTRNNYRAELEQMEFFPDTAHAAEMINNWTARQTGGMVRQIVDSTDFNDMTALVLTNAISFQGKWSRPFRLDSTKPAAFDLGDRQIQIPMMHLKDTCRLATVDGLQVLEKTYGSGDMSMLILLPDKQAGAIAKLERELSESKVAEWLAALQTEKVDLFLPRFKLQSVFDLQKALESLGMPLAFQWPGADFSGITGAPNFFVSKIKQSTFAEVNEKGTRAAAATAVVGTFGGPGPETPTFRADHPFVFLIRDTRTGCILFVGRLVDPGAGTTE